MGRNFDAPLTAPARGAATESPNPQARAGNPSPSTTHLVLIPSYNPGRLGVETVAAARAQWNPVWVVIDGSTDGTAEALIAMAERDPGLRVLPLPDNRGKGAAVLHGACSALAEGFTHALTMDSDGQHPAQCIGAFMAASMARPEALILGEPRFDADAPKLRVRGRRISNWWANVETLGAGIGDSLFGFRVYPLAALIGVMGRGRWMRRFDFDPEVAVRLSWQGVALQNLTAPVRYLRPEQGGVSHFHYGRDNVLLTWMHARLAWGALWRFPGLLRRRFAGRSRRL
jgi:glycosyltransferase involved in cell wall biosynthesis